MNASQSGLVQYQESARDCFKPLLRVFVTVHQEVLVSEAEVRKAMTTFLGVVIATSNWIEETVCGLFGSYRRGPRRYAENWLSTATRKWLLTLGTAAVVIIRFVLKAGCSSII